MALIFPPFCPTHQITHSVDGRVERIPVALLGKAFYTEDGWDQHRPSEFTLGERHQLLCRGELQPGFSLEDWDDRPHPWEIVGTLPGIG